MREFIWPALSFTLGALLTAQFSSLPDWPWLAPAWLVSAWLMMRRGSPLAPSGLRPCLPLLAAFVLGLVWAWTFAAWRLQDRLPSRLENRDITLAGRIADLPQRFELGWRFNFVPDSPFHPRLLRLSWYQAPAAPKAGERWRLTVRLKRPHGTFNPGGFDYERWLLVRGIGATGYVRPAADNERLSEGSAFDHQVWRQSLADRVDGVLAGKPFAGVVRALVMGDENGIDQGQWQVLSATGTAHLVAISGSHIGLIAGLVYWSTAKLAARSGLMRYAPPVVAAWTALLAAWAYTALADFTTPACRALLMSAVVLGAVAWRRHVRISHGYALALFLVVLYEPLDVLTPGFWLSFVAVALIFLVVAGRLRPPAAWLSFLRINWATSLGLAPLLVVLFQQAPWVAPLANLIAIPVLGIMAVPLSLLGALALLLGMDERGLLLLGAEQLLQWCWPLLQWLAALPGIEWRQPMPPPWSLALAALAALLCLMPRGLPGRWLALPLLLPALTWQGDAPAPGDFRLSLLDVGQGLSAVVRTAGHTLVFDAGPRLGGTMDAGRSVVAPFLRAELGGGIDALVISHPDNDHAGGADYLLDHLPVARLYSSVSGGLPARAATLCQAGQHWQWDGVAFAMLSPWDAEGSENDRSCVLKITGRHGSALLTGDIEASSEARLVQSYGAQLVSTVLVVPHHGSNTSSSEAFLRAVAPRYALFPVGYHNRFGFPHPAVLQRYQNLGVQIEQTSRSGALTLNFAPPGISLERYRDRAGRYWNWRAP
ncbi:MAG: DNA internalization-related competence protein ComEC/Rec2 [Methylococcaceae bacterium]|nr:MAG: DNA internalization-related competence protein ComEC/Rec2 [Methylococcaceae bacterium]